MSLTDQIAADLRRRLEQEDPLDLRIEALAKRYRVSTQPVRHALARLTQEGVLKDKRRNGRRGTALEPAAGVSDDHASPAEMFPLEPEVDDVHRRLSRHAVALSLKGEATFLREESTAALLGVSRGLAREALQRLHGEGIVDRVPRRGWKVRAFSRDDLADFLEVREVLEVRALMLAWPRLDRAQIEEYLQGNLPHVEKPDNRLHDYWIDLSGNRYIRRFFAQHAPFFSTLFDWEDHNREAALQSCEQHRAILEAILDDDRDRACDALMTHIHGNHPVLERIVDQPPTP